MFTLVVAMLLNHPATATVAFKATVSLETVRAEKVERHNRAEELGHWLNKLDGERQAALARYSPFADADSANPFE
jgi:hypothetical protein